MRSSIKRSTLLILAGFLAVFSACKKDPLPVNNQQITTAFSGQVVRSWNDMFLKVERDAAGYRPCPANRALAYMGLSAYEACIKGMPNFKSMAGLYAGLQIPPLKDNTVLHWPTVVNASYAYLMQHFFITSSLMNDINALEAANNSLYQSQISSTEFTVSQNYGSAVAMAVWEWSKTDLVGHDAYLDPFPSFDWSLQYMGPGDWVPTLPGGGQPAFPHWGEVRAFAIQPTDRLCAPPGSSALYTQQGQEILSISQTLTYDQKWMAEFWRDDFLHLTFGMGPRWIAIANQVYKNEEVDLQQAVYCNAKLGFALNDATVACWFSKFHYNRESPVTLIQREFDPNWHPLLNNPLTGETGLSPNYPSYPCDNATLGGAAAEVLTNIFGQNYAMADRSHENEINFLGMPRNFTSFSAMAEENAESRIINGVNFRMDTEEGLAFGQHCGQRVNALQWTN